MRTLFLAISLTAYSLTAFSQSVIRVLPWELDTARPAVQEWQLVRGETADLECRYLSGASAMDVRGATVVLHARTNGMPADLSFQVTGRVGRVSSTNLASVGWVTVRVRPDLDLPHDVTRCTFTLETTLDAARNLVATGLLRLSGDPTGATPAAVPVFGYDPAGSAQAVSNALATAVLALSTNRVLQIGHESGPYINADGTAQRGAFTQTNAWVLRIPEIGYSNIISGLSYPLPLSYSAATDGALLSITGNEEYGLTVSLTGQSFMGGWESIEVPTAAQSVTIIPWEAEANAYLSWVPVSIDTRVSGSLIYQAEVTAQIGAAVSGVTAIAIGALTVERDALALATITTNRVSLLYNPTNRFEWTDGANRLWRAVFAGSNWWADIPAPIIAGPDILFPATNFVVAGLGYPITTNGIWGPVQIYGDTTRVAQFNLSAGYRRSLSFNPADAPTQITLDQIGTYTYPNSGVVYLNYRAGYTNVLVDTVALRSDLAALPSPLPAAFTNVPLYTLGGSNYYWRWSSSEGTYITTGVAQ